METPIQASAPDIGTDCYVTPEEIIKLREDSRKIVVAHELDKYIETKMGGPPDQCVVGKSVDLRITVDVLELCNIVGGRWKIWADQVVANRTAIQRHYDAR